MSGMIPQAQDFDSDIMPAATGSDTSQDDVRDIITAIARASHAIAELVALGDLALAHGRAGLSADADGPAAIARDILVEHLAPTRVKALHCAGDADPTTLDDSALYVVTIDPLEGSRDAEANLPFGTIFSIAKGTDGPSSATPTAAGFIHYGPQTNLVLSLGAGVHIFHLDRSVRTYRLAAENVRVPGAIREWAVDATKRGRWSPLIRSLIDEQLEAADTPGAAPTDMRWTGSLTADAYRILRRGGVYLNPEDDQPGCENACPNLRYAARPIAYIIEQAGGRATTGTTNITDVPSADDNARTPLIFGSSAMVARIERLHALPEKSFDRSPLFRQRGLFRTRRMQ